jgi:hypothetical protein
VLDYEKLAKLGMFSVPGPSKAWQCSPDRLQFGMDVITFRPPHKEYGDAP